MADVPLTEAEFIHVWAELAPPSADVVDAADANAAMRKSIKARGQRSPRVQKGTALMRADMRVFGAFRGLELQQRALKKEVETKQIIVDPPQEECARMFDIRHVWRSVQTKRCRYLYLRRFVHQADLHAKLAIEVLGDSAGLLARFVRVYTEQPEASHEGALAELMIEYRTVFKQWVLGRIKQM